MHPEMQNFALSLITEHKLHCETWYGSFSHCVTRVQKLQGLLS